MKYHPKWDTLSFQWYSNLKLIRPILHGIFYSSSWKVLSFYANSRDHCVWVAQRKYLSRNSCLALLSTYDFRLDNRNQCPSIFHVIGFIWPCQYIKGFRFDSKRIQKEVKKLGRQVIEFCLLLVCFALYLATEIFSIKFTCEIYHHNRTLEIEYQWRNIFGIFYYFRRKNTGCYRIFGWRSGLSSYNKTL